MVWSRLHSHALWVVRIALPALLLHAAGCGSDGLDPNADNDDDGVSINQGDCDDLNATVYPGAPEPCDEIDQDCDDRIDEDFDQDGDGYTTCGGDCADNDPTSNPVQAEVVDGLDNDCDGIADNHTEQYDDDGDGYSEDQGDCDDGTTLVGPNAIEVALDEDGNPEGRDNDCDGEVDEALPECSTDRSDLGPGPAWSNALDVCHGVQSAGWSLSKGIAPTSRNIVSSFGSYNPRGPGPDMVVLSSGLAVDRNGPGWTDPVEGTEFSNGISHPDPQGDPQDGCGVADPAEVSDYTELKLTLNVPSNVNGFSFDFNFMSGEFPEFVCDIFDDTFLAVLDSQAYDGNVSFDELGNRISINVGFFDVCDPDPFYVSETANCTGGSNLTGSGFEGYGGTGWLTTTAPLKGGEKATLTFMIFDEGDRIYDSLVLIDNFRWEFEEIDGPNTVDRLPSQDFTLADPVGPDDTARARR